MSDMKKGKLMITAAVMAAHMSMISYADQWVHVPHTGYDYRDIWQYIKDDGRYARQEWVYVDGIWYWIDEVGNLPSAARYTDEIHCCNSKGEYIDLNNGRRFVTRESGRRVQAGMSYSRIVDEVGWEHETVSASQTQDGIRQSDHRVQRWYTKDLRSWLDVTFTNGVAGSAEWFSPNG